MEDESLTKRERKQLRRQERLEAETGQKQKAYVRRFLVTGAVILAVVGGVLYVGRELMRPLPGKAQVNEGQEHIELGASHAPYKTNPPTSGPHYVQQANWGIHKAFIPNEYQVHNLEHGGVIVHYRCPSQVPTPGLASPSAVPIVQHGEALAAEATISASVSARENLATPSGAVSGECLELEAKLAQAVSQYPSKVILMPNPTISTKVALTAWTRLDTFDEVDLDRAKRFIDAWRDRGPEKVSDNMPSTYFL